MISLVIFGIAAYISSLAIGNQSVKILVILFITALVCALLSLLYFRPYIEVTGRLSVKSLLFSTLPYLVLLPGAVLLLTSIRIQLSYHGPFHMGYIFQVIHGFSPPENVVLPGYAANVYWLYHALLAVLVDIFNTTPLKMSAFLNISALIASLYWVRKSLGLLTLGSIGPFFKSSYSLIILLGINLFSSAHIALKFMFSDNSSLQGLAREIVDTKLIWGGDIRLLGLIQKFFNFNGTPLGVLFFCFSLYVCLLILKKGLSTKRLILLVVAISGGLIFHTTSGLFMLLIIPISLIITLIYTRTKELKKYLYSTDISEWTILSLSCLFLFGPVSHYVYSAAAALPAETHVGSSIGYLTRSITSSIYPLIPLSFLGIYMARNEKTDILTLFGTISFLGYLLSVLVSLPGNNQYKFVYLSTISFSFLSIIGLYYAYFKTKGVLRVLGKILSYTVFIIFFLSIFAIEFRYYKKWGVEKANFYTENKKIYGTKDTDYIEIYEWIRENTREDTIVILPLVSKDSDIRPGTINSHIFFVGERLPYVAYGDVYAEGISEYKSRVQNVNLFYSANTPSEKKLKILEEFEKFSKEKPSILLIPKENLESISSYLGNLELIYSARDAALYKFKN